MSAKPSSHQVLKRAQNCHNRHIRGLHPDDAMFRELPKASQFALDILRRHPQISFEHALSAAEYEGVTDLTITIFRSTQKRLGIALAPLEEPEAEASPPAEPAGPAERTEHPLLARLEGIRSEYRQTAEFRTALQDIRTAVNAALGELS